MVPLCRGDEIPSQSCAAATVREAFTFFARAAVRGMIRRLAVSAFAAAAVLVAALLLKPPLPDSLQSSNDGIVLVEPGDLGLPRLPVTASRVLPFTQQFDWPMGTPRQYDYSAPVNLPPSQNLGVYVPFIGADAQLFVNNVPAGDADRLDFAGPGTGDHRLLARIPSYYLKAAFNRIDVVAPSDGRHVGMRYFYLGDFDTLLLAAGRMDTWRTVAQRTGLACAVVGLLSSLLSILLRRRIRLHLALAPVSLTTLAYGVLSLPPLWINAGVLGTIIGSLIALGLRQRSARQSGGFFDGLLIAALVSAIAAAMLALVSILPPGSTWLISVANLGQLPLLAIGLPLLLGSDVVMLRRELAAARAIAAEQTKIASSAEEALRDEIRARAIVEERQRFVRDMHDGIGGQMQALLMRLRMRKIAIADVETEVAAGLVDLRLVADSLDHVGTDLAQALATFHTRARQQFDAVGIRFVWNQSGDCARIILDPRAILNVYRILQEALTNCVRHAQAHIVTVTVELPIGADMLTIRFEDDGRGFAASAGSGGRGLANMAERATRLGATLDVISVPGKRGSRIELIVPVQAHEPS